MTDLKIVKSQISPVHEGESKKSKVIRSTWDLHQNPFQTILENFDFHHKNLETFRRWGGRRRAKLLRSSPNVEDRVNRPRGLRI